MSAKACYHQERVGAEITKHKPRCRTQGANNTALSLQVLRLGNAEAFLHCSLGGLTTYVSKSAIRL